MEIRAFEPVEGSAIAAAGLKIDCVDAKNFNGNKKEKRKYLP
jgi:hypothetical protein